MQLFCHNARALHTSSLTQGFIKGKSHNVVCGIRTASRLLPEVNTYMSDRIKVAE